MIYLVQRILQNQFIRFGMVGGSGLVVDLAALAIFVELIGLDPFVGRILSIWLAMTNNWFWNRVFTFKSEGSPLGEYLRFVLVNSVGALINYASFTTLLLLFSSLSSYISVIIATLIAMVFNFVLSKLYAFKA